MLAVEFQIFIPRNCFVPKDVTRVNGLAGGFMLFHGWPHLTDGSVFLSLRLWFQKFKTTRPRKDKSLSVCFRKSKPNKIHVGGFWRELLICLSGMGLLGSHSLLPGVLQPCSVVGSEVITLQILSSALTELSIFLYPGVLDFCSTMILKRHSPVPRISLLHIVYLKTLCPLPCSWYSFLR